MEDGQLQPPAGQPTAECASPGANPDEPWLATSSTPLPQRTASLSEMERSSSNSSFMQLHSKALGHTSAAMALGSVDQLYSLTSLQEEQPPLLPVHADGCSPMPLSASDLGPEAAAAPAPVTAGSPEHSSDSMSPSSARQLAHCSPSSCPPQCTSPLPPLHPSPPQLVQAAGVPPMRLHQHQQHTPPLPLTPSAAENSSRTHHRRAGRLTRSPGRAATNGAVHFRCVRRPCTPALPLCGRWQMAAHSRQQGA